MGVLVDDHDAVRLLTFDRPDVLNAFDGALYHATADALAAAQDDDMVKVVVLTGAGRAFSAGQDLKEMTRLAEAAAAGTLGGGGEAATGFPALLDAVQGFDKPLVAAVNGLAIGIGFTILAHCDLVLVAEDARLRAPFAPLGVAPEAASSYLFPLRMGWQRAAYVLLSGEWVTAEQAVEFGIALQTTAPERVLSEALDLAASIAVGSLASLRAIKRTMLAAQTPGVVAARAREDAEFQELLETFGAP
jgi:enoyl-CoA hydratase/carnithine racemase